MSQGPGLCNIHVTDWGEEIENILSRFTDLGGKDMFDD